MLSEVAEIDDIEDTPDNSSITSIATLTLSRFVEQKLSYYFSQLEGQPPQELYRLVMKEAEKGLLRVVMEKAKGNQSLAADMLGLARGTLRRKLEEACLD